MNDSPVDCQNREWTEPQRDHTVHPYNLDSRLDYPIIMVYNG